MLGPHEYRTLFWLAPAAAIVAVIGRALWLYRGSLTWPTADGSITRLDIERKRGASGTGGHYFCATFTYEFLDPNGRRLSGTWYKNFSSELEARDFAARELPAGKTRGSPLQSKKSRLQRFGTRFLELHQRPPHVPQHLRVNAHHSEAS
ncbi:MAG: hypothetical protein ACM3WP_02355 [Acidobacteriota bacterium]